MSKSNNNGQEPFGINQTFISDEEGVENIRQIEVMSGRGDTRKSLTNTLMGFNHRISTPTTPKNKERGGYTFFTRPDLNLNYANLKESRRLLQFAEAPMNSSERAILAMLDPLCPLTSPDGQTNYLGNDCHNQIPFDNKQAFIPVLSNRLTALSGFPDNTLDFFTSEQGLKREQWSMVDSHYAANFSYTLSATFNNLEGDIITQLLTTWLESCSRLYDGSFIPRTRNIIQNEICYQTRIYRLVMDENLKYVTKIGAANLATPMNDNLGAVMSFNSEELISTTSDQVNIQFQCDGATYLDPILIEEFNEVVGMFNPSMLADPKYPDEFVPLGGYDVIKLKSYELDYFNNYGYPHINRQTRELTWWVMRDTYEKVLASLGFTTNDDNALPIEEPNYINEGEI